MITTREVKIGEYDTAIDLTWRVFLEFEAPDYSRQGVDNFNRIIHEDSFLGEIRMYGAFDDKKLVGILATRSKGNHIALFFVESKYHKKGIGKLLFMLACKDNTSGKISVNSSPYAVEVYRHLGFTPTNTEQLSDGIRYTPMECLLNV